MIPVIPLFIVLRTKTLYPNIFHSNINILNSFHMISLQTMSTNINQLQNLICLFVGSQTNQTSIIIRKHNTLASNSSCIKKQMLKLPRFHNIWYLSFPFEQIHYITLINMQLNVKCIQAPNNYKFVSYKLFGTCNNARAIILILRNHTCADKRGRF